MEALKKNPACLAGFIFLKLFKLLVPNFFFAIEPGFNQAG